MLKKSFWQKFMELFKPQYYIAAMVTKRTETFGCGREIITAMHLEPIFKGGVVEIKDSSDLRNYVIISTNYDLSDLEGWV